MKELWAVARPRKQRGTYYFRCERLSHERMAQVAKEICGSAVIPSIVGAHEVPAKLLPLRKVEDVQIYFEGRL